MNSFLRRNEWKVDYSFLHALMREVMSLNTSCFSIVKNILQPFPHFFTSDLRIWKQSLCFPNSWGLL